MAVDLLIHTGWLWLFAGFATNFKGVVLAKWLILLIWRRVRTQERIETLGYKHNDTEASTL